MTDSDAGTQETAGHDGPRAGARRRPRGRRRPLRPALPLARAAREHSGFLAGRGVLQHEDARGRPFWVRLVAAGHPRDRAMGESLAEVGGCGAGPARRAVGPWMASPGHRANLLSPRYRTIGMGAAATGGREAAVLTADFGG